MSRKKKISKGVLISPFEKIVTCVVDYLIVNHNKISLKRLETILYENYIVEDFFKIETPFSGGQLVDEFTKLINRFDPVSGLKMVSWLFKEHIPSVLIRNDKKEKYFFDDACLNLFKEVLWIIYYISNKPSSRILLIGNTYECLSRLQGVYLAINQPTKIFAENKRKYLINALSLKDNRYDFLPYPEQIDPTDLENILIVNGLRESHDSLMWAVRNLGKDPYSAYERYHVFKFVRDLVNIALTEKTFAKGYQHAPS